jgi:hypothetical protein
VTAAIYELRDALLYGVGGAIDDLNSREVVIRSRFEDTGPADIPSFANGTDGPRYFGSGTLAMLHGWEEVIPRGKESSTQAPIIFAPTIELDGDVLYRSNAARNDTAYRTRVKVAAV